MDTVTLGTWSNPPLAYVVAELVISPYYSINNLMPALQDQLRAAYPRTIEAQEVIFDGNAPINQPVWRLSSSDQAYCVQLGTRSIALHVTKYSQSTDFINRWAEILDAVVVAKLDAFVERAGLRYIDIIIPSGDKEPSDYLAETLKGVSPEGSLLTGSMWSAGFQYDSFVVNMRVSAPSPQGIIFPPDFSALPLSKPTVVAEAEKRIMDNKPIGFIDTDCIKNIQEVFDAVKMISIYTEMQKLASQTFKAALSKTAKGEWM